MRYQLFSDLDMNFGIHIIDEETDQIIREIAEHPKTKKKLTRDEAIEIAEAICNPQHPKTKSEFLTRMSDEDFQNFYFAKLDVDERFDSFLVKEIPEHVSNQKMVLSKFDLLQDFEFSEKDIKTLEQFCSMYNISVMPKY